MVVDDVMRSAPACVLGRRAPDFFIVGQAKSGTTALYEMLRRHPQIYMPDVKEPWFFSNDLESQASGRVSETFDDYLSLFDAARSDQLIGEASVSYLWSRTAAGRIADLQPAARIIAIFREPASFLRSLHLQFVQNHIEMENDFRKAISLENARRQGSDIPNSPWPQLLLYSEHVRYVEQLHRYHAVFPPENILVLIYDDFRRDNGATLRTVQRFLDVDDAAPIGVMEANPTVRVRSQRFNNLVYAITMGRGSVPRALKAGAKALTSRRLRRHALELTQRRFVYASPRPPDERLMIELRRRFKPEVEALSKYLDRDLVTLWDYDSLD